MIATVAPAMAYTGHGLDGITRVRPHAELVADLVARGIDPALADGLARNGDETERQARAGRPAARTRRPRRWSS